MSIYVKILKTVINDPEVLKDLPSMSNIEMKTMGGKTFWRDLANVDGWRIQEHILTGNCRILDPQNVRKAWGGKQAMLNAFDELIEKFE